MPKIPTYDSPTVQSRGIPNASIRTGGVSADAFGAGLGRAMGQASDVLEAAGRAIDQANEKQAVADGLDATQRLNDEARQKQQEFSALKGKDARNVQKDFSAWYDKRSAEIGGELTDKRAASLFDKNMKRMRASDDDWAFNYSQRQDDVYFEATTDSAIKSAQQSAIFNPTTENIAQQISVAHDVYRDIALRKGLDANWVNQNTDAMRQKTYGDILQNSMQQDAVGSVSSFLAEHGESVDPGLRGQAEKWVHKKNIAAETEAFADSLVGGGVDYADALDAATKKYNGEDQGAALSAVRSVYAGRNRAQKQASAAAVDALEAKAYKAGGWAGVKDDDIDALADVDAGAALRVRKAKEAELGAAARKDGKARTESDPDALAEASSRLFDDADNKITKPEQLEVYRPFLTKTDFNSLLRDLGKDRKVSEAKLEEAYLQYAPANIRATPRKKWTQEQELNFFNFKQTAMRAVSDTASPDRVYKDAASWWLEGKYKPIQNATGLDKLRNLIPDKTTQGEAITAGRGGDFEATSEVPRDAMTEAGFVSDEIMRKQQERTVVRYGTLNGRRVAKYSDGSIEYVK